MIPTFYKRKHGFTLVELIIVVFIMLLIFSPVACVLGSCFKSGSSERRVSEEPTVTEDAPTLKHVERIDTDKGMVTNVVTVTKVPVYHVTFEFTQSSFTLNIAQHIRNAANAFDFTVPVTKEFYDSVHEGQKLDSKFKTASFILGGHIGNRVINVKQKFIKWTTKRSNNARTES